MDEEVPGYARYVAGLKCLKYWAALRFDDLWWVDPEKVAKDKRWVTLHLERTKVSGPGKAVERRAGGSTSGLSSEGLSARECPTCGQCQPRVSSGPSRFRPRFAASRALSELLRQSGGTPLLLCGAGGFWTEHSERNAMPSAAAALREGRDVQERLGRWKAGASESYVRTTRLIVERFQSELAQRIRGGEGGPDFLDEESILGEMRVYAQGLGYSGDDLENFISGLTYFDAPVDPEAAPNGPMQALQDIGESSTDPARSDDEAETNADGPSAKADGPDPEDPVEELSGYVVSEVGRRHALLAPLAPLLADPGQGLPEVQASRLRRAACEAYDRICKACWPEREGLPTSSRQEASEGGESIAESTSEDEQWT